MDIASLISTYGLTQFQGRLLSLSVFDVSGLRRRIEKDFQRIEWFVEAAFTHHAELMVEGTLAAYTGQAATAEALFNNAHGLASRVSYLQGQYFKVAKDAPGKISLGRLISGWDPFKNLREEARQIAIDYELDPELRKELGCKK